MDSVQDIPAKSRFELHTQGIVAFITYTRDGKTFSLNHEEVPEEASGKGIGSALAKGALDLLRSRGEKVIPRCPFIAVYMQRHKETQDLLADPAFFDKHR